MGKYCLINKIEKTKAEIREQYLADKRPFVITFSGGKDSTFLLHLTLEVIVNLHNDGIELKQSYIISSDTKVELPVISNFLQKTLEQLEIFCEKENLKIEVILVKPKIEESFFSLMIGKGYPPPNRIFRWCTDRLKIRPTLYYFQQLTKKHNSVIMLLGVRKDESQSRKDSINSRERNHRNLSMHDSIPNAFIFSPIVDFTTDEVWDFLLSNTSPYGNNYSELALIYANGSGEDECGMPTNGESPSCGNSRFGCWTCTVVSTDKSMEGMLKVGNSNLEVLHEYRSMLMKIREDPTKRSSRRKNGTSGMGDFLMEIRFQLLENLLKAEKKIGETLISDDEILQIQKFWDSEGNLNNQALRIANRLGRNFHIFENSFDLVEQDVNLDIFKKVIEIEQKRKLSGNRKGIIIEIENQILSHFKRIFSENQ
jgi:DNA sulfur modification protein DndC